MSIAQGSGSGLRAGTRARRFLRLAPLGLLLAALSADLLAKPLPGDAEDALREQFLEAWSAARSGRRDEFERFGPSLKDYRLYPYWQYEDYRHRRAQVAPATMAAFLEQHEDWAFTRGLRSAWLRTLGKNRRWQALLRYGGNSSNTEIRCYHARAKLAAGETSGVLAEARALWAVGKSQPDACDPLFKWLIDNDGVTPELAWERIRLAMLAGNSRLTVYLARFLPPQDREWLERWQRLDQGRYRRLDRATRWHDSALTQMISIASLQRLSRIDPAAAMRLFDPLDDHFDWLPEARGELMREVALWAAVALEPGVDDFIRRVPPAHRNDQLHEWWARFALSEGDWAGVLEAIDWMSAETGNDERWRFWRARAQLAANEPEAGKAGLQALATRTSYFGFLAADALRQPYTICPREPLVEAAAIEQLARSDRFARALELHRVDLDSWARAEWANASRALPVDQLKVAAGLARREGWHDRVIFALGDSGELSFYEWRFPVLHTDAIMAAASTQNLEPAWIYGLIRAESAMMETARSSAGALGLMQIMPGTARTLSARHGLAYGGSSDLLQGERNIEFGTTYLRQLMDELDQNPVLASGAYNAGPGAVSRWLDGRSQEEAALFIETLPYYETRDYIPRVLTFATLYDWRLENPVRRISSRMPGIESGTIAVDSTVQVVCRAASEDDAVAGP